MASIRGDLSIMPLGDFLQWLSNNQISGVLTVDSGTSQGRFAVQNGHIIRAQTSEKRSSLGQFLVNASLITEDQLQRALAQQATSDQEWRGKGEPQSLGYYLLKRDFVEKSALEETIITQITELLLETMLWQSGVFVFNNLPVVHQSAEIPVEVSLRELRSIAADRSPIWERFHKHFSNKKAILTLEGNDAHIEHSFDSIDSQLLKFAAHRMTLESAILELHAPYFQAFERIATLEHEGFIKIGAPDPKEPTTLDIKIEDLEQHDHAHAARHAFESENYRVAIGHATAELITTPGDEKLVRLRSEARKRLETRLSNDLPSLDATPRLLKKLTEVRNSRRLSAKEHYILSRVDGQRSLEAIVRVSPMKDIDAFKLFQNFVREDIIRF